MLDHTAQVLVVAVPRDAITCTSVVKMGDAMSTGYLNKVELKDGQIILFHRSTTSKRPIYQMRVHVRGMRDLGGKAKPYFFGTTNESDLDEAKRVALDKYEDLRVSVKHNLPIAELKFTKLYELWWAEKQVKLHANFAAKGRTGKTQRIKYFEGHSTRYWLDYFGGKKASELNQSFINGYWIWRIGYWSKATEADKKQHSNYALNPSKKSLDMEQSALREIFGWAHANKLMPFVPVIENPFVGQGIAAKRRASFDVADWQRLRVYMDRWVLGKGDADKRVNSHHQYQRKLLQIYLHWLAYTGMRTGEVLKLRHRDIEVSKTEQFSVPTLRIRVPKDTKTGARDVVALPNLIAWYDALVELTGRDGNSEWLFCDAQGKLNTGFNKTVPKLFGEAGVLLDTDGERRSAYSLRHFYAEQRLIELGTNVRAFDIIGANIGTGRQYLETHYVRKGVLADEDALVTGSGLRMGKTVDRAEVDSARGE